MRHYPQTLRFLIAFLLYNDAVQAVIALSAQFGSEELKMSMADLTEVILMVQFLAFFGSFLFDWIAKWIGAKPAVIVSLLIWTGVLVAMYVSVRTETQFFIVAAVVALVLGGTQALSRSLFSLMIPKGREAEYFGVYEISDKGTSWLCPLLFGLALQFTGSYRLAILSLITFFAAGLLVLLTVNVQHAAAEARLTKRPAAFFCSLQHFQERVFLNIQLVPVAFRIDERIRAFAELRIFFRQIVHRWMRTERNIARQRPQQFEAALILAGDVGNILVVHQDVARIHAHAADNDDIVGLAVFLRLGGPGGAAARVAGREMGHQRGSAQLHFVAIVQRLIQRMRLVAGPDLHQRGHVLLHGHHLRARQFFHQGVAFHVVGMRVAAEQNLDVGEFESQLLHRASDHRDRGLKTTIEQNVSLRRDEQKRRRATRSRRSRCCRSPYAEETVC